MALQTPTPGADHGRKIARASADCEEEKTRQSVYLFYEACKGVHNMIVYEINKDSLSMNVAAKMKRGSVNKMGYVAHGSKLYAIGGEETDKVRKGLPREVHVFDLSKRNGGSEGGYDWDVGPALLSGKPAPMIVVVKNKIYALAGNAIRDYPADETVVFEVLDLTEEAGWKRLPDPPFISWYKESVDDPVVICYTVVDHTIYLLVEKRGTQMVASFDVDSETWSYVGRESMIEETVRKCCWYGRADVVENVLYDCCAIAFSVMLFAFSLQLDSEQIVPNHGQTKMDTTVEASSTNSKLNWEPSFSNFRRGACLRLPLVHKPAQHDACYSCRGIHLGNKTFLLVSSYFPQKTLPRGRRIVYSCLLKLVGDGRLSSRGIYYPSDHALILRQSYKTMSTDLVDLRGW